jgi:hypothetical protein
VYFILSRYKKNDINTWVYSVIVGTVTLVMSRLPSFRAMYSEFVLLKDEDDIARKNAKKAEKLKAQEKATKAFNSHKLYNILQTKLSKQRNIITNGPLPSLSTALLQQKQDAHCTNVASSADSGSSSGSASTASTASMASSSIETMMFKTVDIIDAVESFKSFHATQTKAKTKTKIVVPVPVPAPVHVIEKSVMPMPMPMSMPVASDSPDCPDSSDIVEELACIVCMSNRIEVVLIPCGHHQLCKACCDAIVEKTGMCPYCKEDITFALDIV